jgi:hypothetical protein
VTLWRTFLEYEKQIGKARALVAAGEPGQNAELAALNQARTALLLRVLASAAIVLIVIDMIWKPGH